MRLHTSSHVPSILNKVDALSGYEDSIVRYRLDNTLGYITQEIGLFNIEAVSDDVLKEFISIGKEGPFFDLDPMQLALVITLVKCENRQLSIGLITAYALKLNIQHSSRRFQNILDVFTKRGIFIAQNVKGVIKYNIVDRNIETLYTPES